MSGFVEKQGIFEYGVSDKYAAEKLLEENGSLRARIRTLEGLLERCEWGAYEVLQDERVCPVCGDHQPEFGLHAPDCELKAALDGCTGAQWKGEANAAKSS